MAKKIRDFKPTRFPNGLRLGGDSRNGFDPFIGSISQVFQPQPGDDVLLFDIIPDGAAVSEVFLTISKPETVGTVKTLSVGTPARSGGYLNTIDATVTISYLNRAPFTVPAGDSIIVTLGSDDWSDAVIELDILFVASLSEVPILDATTFPDIGDVDGPVGADDNNIVVFDGNTGKIIKDSGIDIDDVGDVFGPGSAGDNNIVLFDTATGKLIKDSGRQISVFGDEYQYEEDETTSATTSGTYQSKLVLTTPNIPAGNYKGSATWEMRNTADEAGVEARILIDGAPINELEYEIPEDAGGEYLLFSGFKNAALTNAAHTIELEFRRTGGSGTAQIRRARIEIFRTS